MYTEEQQIDRLAELHRLLNEIQGFVEWPSSSRADYMQSALRSICKYSESMLREASEGHYSIALYLSRHMSVSSRQMLDAAVDKEFNDRFLDNHDDSELPDNGEALVSEAKVREAMLHLLVAAQFSIIMLVLLAMRSADIIKNVRLRPVYDILHRLAEE
ncbi:MAG: hypothetical protein F4X94_03805 [Dehalococcoidia bacterium]|nr:hypothetical protein [Dehalococcoidia bacterium]